MLNEILAEIGRRLEAREIPGIVSYDSATGTYDITPLGGSGSSVCVTREEFLRLSEEQREPIVILDLWG